MKRLITPSILVTIFLAPSLALMNTSGSHSLVGSVGTQTIRVDASRRMVSIQDDNVLSEWNGIMDYRNALLAAKLFNKMACVLAKMEPAAFPSLDEIAQALGEQASGHYPPTRGLTYTVLPSRVKNLAQYGVAVKELCRAVPAYFARQQKVQPWRLTQTPVLSSSFCPSWDCPSVVRSLASEPLSQPCED